MQLLKNVISLHLISIDAMRFLTTFQPSENHTAKDTSNLQKAAHAGHSKRNRI